jgi:hypothetical protein
VTEFDNNSSSVSPARDCASTGLESPLTSVDGSRLPTSNPDNTPAKLTLEEVAEVWRQVRPTRIKPVQKPLTLEEASVLWLTGTGIVVDNTGTFHKYLSPLDGDSGR